jgi:hypothetical protein
LNDIIRNYTDTNLTELSDKLDKKIDEIKTKIDNYDVKKMFLNEKIDNTEYADIIIDENYKGATKEKFRNFMFKFDCDHNFWFSYNNSGPQDYIDYLDKIMETFDSTI